MKQHHRQMPILFLSILFIVVLTACQNTDSHASASNNTAPSHETPASTPAVVLSQQEIPEIYQNKTIVNDNSRLDLIYRPTLEEVIPHTTEIVQATVNDVGYTSIGSNAWTVIDATVKAGLSGNLSSEKNITIYAYGGYISMKDVVTADQDRERYTDMTDEDLENTIIHQAADMEESPLIGEQYIFFLGSPTANMPTDAYEQLGWKFCQMLVGENQTLYYMPYMTEDAPSPINASNDIASITLDELKTLIKRYS